MSELTPSSDFFSDVRDILPDARRAAHTAPCISPIRRFDRHCLVFLRRELRRRLLLCTDKDHALIEYALGGMDENLFVSTYKSALPKPDELEAFLLRELLFI